MISEAETREQRERVRTKILSDIVSNAKLTEERWDPLDVNSIFSQLPGFIRIGVYDQLYRQAIAAVERSRHLDISASTDQELISPHRDLAMLITSAIPPSTHQKEPDIDILIPGSGDALHIFGDRDGYPDGLTDGIYTGIHSRRFTDKQVELALPNEDGSKIYQVYAEDFFKVPIGEAMLKQHDFIQSMLGVSKLEVTDPEFAQVMQEGALQFSSVVAAMTVVMKYLPVKYFSQLSQDFFRRLIIRGRTHFHSGSQMTAPFVVDKVLEIAPEFADDPEYKIYFDENMSSARSNHKIDFANIENNLKRRSLIDRLFQEIPGYKHATPERQQAMLAVYYQNAPTNIRDSILATYNLVNELFLFRKPHVKSIDNSLEYRKNNESTGGHIDIPYKLLAITEARLKQLKPFVDEHRKQAA